MRRRTLFCGILAALLLLTATGELVLALDLEQDILERSMQYLGRRYRTGGVGPQEFDCSGFILYLFRPHIPGIPRVSRDMARFGKPLGREALRPGDLVFFATGGTRDRITHVALFIGQDSVVHAVSDGPERGVTVSAISSGYWAGTYHSAGRVFSEEVWAPRIPLPQPGTGAAPVQDREVQKSPDSGRQYAKGTYYGDLSGGEPSGPGRLEYRSGDTYEGIFSRGFPGGTGTYTWSDGRTYDGNFRFGALEGEGRIAYPDGSHLHGLWHQGRLQVVLSRSSRGTASTRRTGDIVETYHQVKDSPWDSWEGIVRGDYELWRESEQREFEEFMKQQQGQRNR